MSALLQSAIMLAGHGMKVFQVWNTVPLSDGRSMCGCGRLSCPNPGKHPHPRFAPKGLHSASKFDNVVRHWWTQIPAANIGIATGDIVVVLDIDADKGGFESLSEIEGKHGDLPVTWRAITGGGGEHVYFTAPAGTEIRNSVEKIGPGLDIRGAGGYVVAPPSVHVSGRTYAWSVDYHPDDDVPLTAMPGWLVSLASDTSGNATAPTPASEWRDLVRDGASEGARNASLARLAGHLLRRFVDPVLTLELLQTVNASRFRPPLSEEEVTTVVASIARKELRRREARDGRR